MMLHPRTYEGRPLWGRAVYTALHGARLSSVPSGDQSANPASVPGRSGLQRAFLSVSSAQKCSGAGKLATPSGVSRELDRPSPAGPPFQGTELAALSTLETSLERLVRLVDYSAAWKLRMEQHGNYGCGDRQLDPVNCLLGQCWSSRRPVSPQS